MILSEGTTREWHFENLGYLSIFQASYNVPSPNKEDEPVTPTSAAAALTRTRQTPSIKIYVQSVYGDVPDDKFSNYTQQTTHSPL